MARRSVSKVDGCKPSEKSTAYADTFTLPFRYPAGKSKSKPGVVRGTCDSSSGVPATVQADSPGASVTFVSLKNIGSLRGLPESTKAVC